ncbi:uncharacterized protein LOC107178699 [Citrus sinensis]|uniref:uncharacterized protein LOC107178699 n=1 Tax=Citrus sinensis TaxID=2711 RepID=UPI000D62B365|nr:uncharacterized protein LOC107178699 [Citrus sinensis]
MHKRTIAVIVLLGSFMLSVKSDLPCDDSRCKTGSCNSTGACICNIPDPSTILDGDRPFLGGKFCDEEMTMCDGTNEFWCEHGGKCEEIVQGEMYDCKCPAGYAGEHCEHSGTPCGQIFCFHEAQCLALSQVHNACDCPPDWKGSADCSLPTLSQTARYPQDKISNNANWMVGFLAFSCSAGAVVGGAIYAKKLFKKKSNTAPRFQQLSSVQTQDILDGDENE